MTSGPSAVVPVASRHSPGDPVGRRVEFEESRPACRRSAATSARSDSISAACSATTASSSATRAVSSAFRAASSSYDGCSGCGIPEPNNGHKAGTSTDTPQINRGPDWLRRRRVHGLINEYRRAA
jgi:hypothetical protein